MASIKVFLAVFLTFLAASAQADLPCSDGYHVSAPGLRTTCSGGGVILPNKFNVDQLHVNITYLEISGENNVANDDVIPIPYRAKLVEVSFYNFNNRLPLQPRFPLHTLLSTVSHFIKVISLYFVKMVTLTAADFHGFSHLREFMCYTCHLTSIHVDTFSELGIQPNGEVPGYYKSTLENLYIWYNSELEGLDWAFLAPVSSSLQLTSLKTNGLRSELLTRSLNFTLAQSSGVHLHSNRLRYIPAAVYETLNTSLPNLDIMILDNLFCKHFKDEDCSCCELADFGKFLRDNKITGKVELITCGVGLTKRNGDYVFGDPNSHKHCLPPRIPKPKPKRLQ